MDSDTFCSLLTYVKWTNITENNTIDLNAANFTDTFFLKLLNNVCQLNQS